MKDYPITDTVTMTRETYDEIKLEIEGWKTKCGAIQQQLDTAKKGIVNMGLTMREMAAESSDKGWVRVVQELGRDSVNIILQNINMGDSRPIIKVNHAPNK